MKENQNYYKDYMNSFDLTKAYNRESVAYDVAPRPLDLPEKKGAEIIPLPLKKDAGKHQTAQRQSVQAAPKFKLTAVKAMTLTIVCVLLFSLFLDVQNNQTTAQIASLNNKYTALVGQQQILQAEKDSKLSLENIQQGAAALGMRQPDPSQIHYINNDKSDTGVVAGSSKNNTTGASVNTSSGDQAVNP